MFFFFFNDTATTEIYTLSLHDALPIYYDDIVGGSDGAMGGVRIFKNTNGTFPNTSGTYQDIYGTQYSFGWSVTDRKSTRLNSSHANISYAVFCLKKKKKLEYMSPTISK